MCHPLCVLEHMYTSDCRGRMKRGAISKDDIQRRAGLGAAWIATYVHHRKNKTVPDEHFKASTALLRSLCHWCRCVPHTPEAYASKAILLQCPMCCDLYNITTQYNITFESVV